MASKTLLSKLIELLWTLSKTSDLWATYDELSRKNYSKGTKFANQFKKFNDSNASKDSEIDLIINKFFSYLKVIKENPSSAPIPVHITFLKDNLPTKEDMRKLIIFFILLPREPDPLNLNYRHLTQAFDRILIGFIHEAIAAFAGTEYGPELTDDRNYQNYIKLFHDIFSWFSQARGNTVNHAPRLYAYSFLKKEPINQAKKVLRTDYSWKFFFAFVAAMNYKEKCSIANAMQSMWEKDDSFTFAQSSIKEDDEDSPKKAHRKMRRLDKWMDKGFPIDNDVLDEMVAIFREILSVTEDDELSRDSLVHELYKISANKKKLIYSSLEGKFNEIYIFFESNADFKMLWTNNEEFSKDITYGMGLYETMEEGSDELALSYAGSSKSRIQQRILRYDMLDEEAVKLANRKKAIQHNQHKTDWKSARNSDGWLPLLPSPYSSKFIPDAVLAAFTGSIVEICKNKSLSITTAQRDYLIHVIKESHRTGASVDHILGLEPRTNYRGIILGIYIKPQKLIQQEFDYSVKDTNQEKDEFEPLQCKKLLNKFVKRFNKEHVMLPISLNNIAYTGQVKLIFKGGLSPVEVMYIAGIKYEIWSASLHYYKVADDLLERYTSASEKVVSSVIGLVNTKGLIGNPQNLNYLIKLSLPYWKDEIEEIRDTFDERRKLIKKNKPFIRIFSDKEIISIFLKLLHSLNKARKLSSSKKAINECKSIVVAMIAHLVMVSLGLRIGEFEDVVPDDLSKLTHIIKIKGKGSHAVLNEKRVQKMPQNVFKVILLYFALYEKYFNNKSIRSGLEYHHIEGMRKLQTIVRDMDPLLAVGNYHRKTFATRMHKLLYGKNGCAINISDMRGILNIAFELISSPLGHAYRGFEPDGIHATTKYSVIWRVLEKYSQEPVIKKLAHRTGQVFEMLLEGKKNEGKRK